MATNRADYIIILLTPGVPEFSSYIWKGINTFKMSYICFVVRNLIQMSYKSYCDKGYLAFGWFADENIDDFFFLKIIFPTLF